MQSSVQNHVVQVLYRNSKDCLIFVIVQGNQKKLLKIADVLSKIKKNDKKFSLQLKKNAN